MVWRARPVICQICPLHLSTRCRRKHLPASPPNLPVHPPTQTCPPPPFPPPRQDFKQKKKIKGRLESSVLEPCRLGLDFTLMAGDSGAGVCAGVM